MGSTPSRNGVRPDPTIKLNEHADHHYKHLTPSLFDRLKSTTPSKDEFHHHDELTAFTTILIEVCQLVHHSTKATTKPLSFKLIQSHHALRP